MFQHINRFAAVVVAVVDIDRSDHFHRLDRGPVQLPVALADAHERAFHRFLDPHVLVIMNGVLDPIDTLKQMMYEGCKIVDVEVLKGEHMR